MLILEALDRNLYLVIESGRFKKSLFLLLFVFVTQIIKNMAK